ncbi:MAG: hypothetical protein IJK75_06415 [Bacteroidales bacterium]|jgi:hypothetical protein|nr:hypothetical protein [Bacteroidales bacterium]MBQ6302007.1 hypothetical protein [Bacteroidales bacterium]
MDSQDEVKVPNMSSTGENSLNKTYPPSLNKKIIDADLEKERLNKEDKRSERGWLGKLFGAGVHSPNNIAGLLIVILLLVAIGYTFFMLVYCPVETHHQVVDFWGIITPLITLALGYLFGKSS